MPFAEKYREIYDQVYKPVCKELGLGCWRVDEISRPRSITHDIVEGIIDADVIIADLTAKNANVFYELGIAHSVGNKTVMTAQSMDDVPFDIQSYRVIIYDQSISGSKTLSVKLKGAISELITALERTNNPVQAVLGERTSLHFRKRRPLFRIFDFSSLAHPVRELLTARNITFLEDLRNIDIYALADHAGFGKSSLSQLAFLFSEFELYDDPVKFNNFVRTHNIKLTSSPDSYSSANWNKFVETVRANKKIV